MQTRVVLGLLGVAAVGLSAVGLSMAGAGDPSSDFGPPVVIASLDGAGDRGGEPFGEIARFGVAVPPSTPAPSSSVPQPPAVSPSAPAAAPAARPAARPKVVQVPRAPAVPVGDDDDDDDQGAGGDDADDGGDD